MTGYELSISGLVGKKGSSEAATQIVGTSATSHTFTTIKDKNLINNEIYTIKIRSVNGDWRSEWSEEIRIAPKAEEKPAAPDNLKALGGYRSIQLNWKDMDDTDSYNLYYKGPEMRQLCKGQRNAADCSQLQYGSVKGQYHLSVLCNRCQ